MAEYGKRLANQDDRQYVFVRVDVRARRALKAVENPRWVDLYDLLGVDCNAHPREIEEAIVARIADCLCFSFSRGSQKPEDIRLIEEHQREFRPILLNPVNRARYDALRTLHQAPNADAYDYRSFLSTVDLAVHQGCLSVLMAMAAGLVSMMILLCR